MTLGNTGTMLTELERATYNFYGPDTVREQNADKHTYIIVSYGNVDTLVSSVNKLVEQGWQVNGGPFVVNDSASSMKKGAQKIAQCLVRPTAPLKPESD